MVDHLTLGGVDVGFWLPSAGFYPPPSVGFWPPQPLWVLTTLYSVSPLTLCCALSHACVTARLNRLWRSTSYLFRRVLRIDFFTESPIWGESRLRVDKPQSPKGWRYQTGQWRCSDQYRKTGTESTRTTEFSQWHITNVHVHISLWFTVYVRIMIVTQFIFTAAVWLASCLFYVFIHWLCTMKSTISFTCTVVHYITKIIFIFFIFFNY